MNSVSSASDKANSIVNTLMEDESLYKEMSKKEGEVWGKIFSNQTWSDALRSDQAAAAELGLHRNKVGLYSVLKKHDRQPKSGLSLACGGGRAERQLMKNGICTSFHGVDIAEDALKEAKLQADAEGLAITYEKSDLNKIQLDKNKYDLVVTQNCLHHVLRLEYLRDQIFESLAADGLLWVHDYIGETQFQYDDNRMNIVNSLLDSLPKEFHEDIVNKRHVSKLVRKEPGTLVSPFEAIRSAEILPVFLEKFDIVEKFETDALMSFVCPVGTRHHFLKNPEAKALFEMLFAMDKLLIENGILTPREGMYLLTPKTN